MSEALLIKTDLINNWNIKDLIGKPLSPLTKRKGDTGWLGRAVEDVLGIDENNKREPDIQKSEYDADIKTKCWGITCDISTVSCLPTNTTMNDLKKLTGKSRITDKIPYHIDHLGNNQCSKPNNFSLRTDTDTYPFNTLYLLHNDEVVGSWSHNELKDELFNKIHNIILFYAKPLPDNKFFIVDATIFGTFNFESLIDFLMIGYLTFNFKLGSKDRGSIFRFDPHHIGKCYKTNESIPSEYIGNNQHKPLPSISYKYAKSINDEEKQKEIIDSIFG